MQHDIYLPGDEVILKDGRKGVLYAITQNSRNPLARDCSRPANWYFLPDCVGAHEREDRPSKLISSAIRFSKDTPEIAKKFQKVPQS